MKKWSLLILAMLFANSCVSDEELVPSVTSQQERALTVFMQIPGTNIPVTYAFSSINENEIRTVDILVFKVDKTGEHYYKHIFVPDIEQDNNTTKKIQVNLERVDTRLVLLANVNYLFTSEMETSLQHDSNAGDVDKQILLSHLMFNLDKPWSANYVGDANAFPMYGESGVISGQTQMVDNIKMIRSITRIDISNEAGDSKLSIDSVYVFNTKNKGFVAPSFDVHGAILETPHIPVTAKANGTGFGYKFEPNAGKVTPSMEREIYITEDTQETALPTYIVLKVTYDNRPSRFYGVDLKDRNGNLLPFQRNYRYKISITGILGDGYATAAEAVASTGQPALSTTVESNEIGLSKIVFNDQYKMGVSTAEIHFKHDGTWAGMSPGDRYYSLKVYTTYARWTAAWNEDLNDWLRFTDTGINGLTADYPATCLSLNINVTLNTSEKARTGKIRLKAGTLQQEIIIYQDGINTI